MKTRSMNVTVILDIKGRELGRWSVDGPLTVGRTADNDIVINNLSISRRHAVIEPVDGGCVIRDAGSLNGIQVNGAPVREAMLGDGDMIMLGKHRLMCLVDSYDAVVADPSLFDPTVMAEPGELVGTIANPGWLAEVDGDTEHMLDRPLILIGTDEAADIVITGRGIAPYHAEIVWEDGVYTLRHIEGRREVKVDGSAADECVLEDGCAIAIGGWACAFRAPVPTGATD